MLTDAHCHPFDLADVFADFEKERRRLGVLAAVNACTMDDFLFNETLSRNADVDKAAPVLACFGIHPQQPAAGHGKTAIEKQIEMLSLLSSENRICAIGECGFDLYNAAYRETEALQEFAFSAQLEIALKFDLPVILHVRRAIHKIFALTKILSKCKSVIFHSWSGTYEEAQAFLQRGINAYFSFGNTIMLNHKQAKRTCALLPAQRLLTETDAPYQPRRGQSFSCWQDLPFILEAAATLRNEAGDNVTARELEDQIEANFRKIFF